VIGLQEDFTQNTLERLGYIVYFCKAVTKTKQLREIMASRTDVYTVLALNRMGTD